MVTRYLAHVIDKLILLFIFREGAIATVISQGVAELVIGSTRNVEHEISHEAKAKFVHESRTRGVSPSEGHAVIGGGRLPRIPQSAARGGQAHQKRPARFHTKHTGTAQTVSCVAIAPKNGIFFTRVIIPACVPLIGIVRNYAAA